MLRSTDDRGRIIDGFVSILRGKYDTVERREQAVVAYETAFDPEAAHEAGVPEGPKFGRLADGESVTVDGRTVRPETVHTERERRFLL